MKSLDMVSDTKQWLTPEEKEAVRRWAEPKPKGNTKTLRKKKKRGSQK